MIVYSIFKKEHADSVMEEIKYTDKVFSGFVNGKILDALVIALICFIALKIFTICNCISWKVLHKRHFSKPPLGFSIK